MSVDDAGKQISHKWLCIQTPKERRVFKSGKRVVVIWDPKDKAFADDAAFINDAAIEFDTIITLPFEIELWELQLVDFQIAFYRGEIKIKGNEGIVVDLDAILRSNA